MSVTSLLETLERQGVRLRADGDRLLVDAPAGVLTPQLKSELGIHKPELLAHLSSNAVVLHRIAEGPYAGFFQSAGVSKPDPVRAREALLEAERWRQERAAWLRDVLRIEPKEDR